MMMMIEGLIAIYLGLVFLTIPFTLFSISKKLQKIIELLENDS